MAPATVRADYDQLKQLAAGFSQNSQAAQQTLQSIQQNKETLQGGDWVGEGATAFYKEMDDNVLPSLQRLVRALDSASQSLGQISAVMKEAEDQAANVLKGSGAAGAGAGAGATSGAASTAGGGSGAPGGSSVPSGAAGGGTADSGGTGSSAGASSSGGSTLGSAGGTGTPGSAPGSSTPTPTPPDTSTPTRAKVEQTLGGIGMVAEIISILEAGGAAGAAAAGGTVAAAGIGTTVGALILPLGAFFLGTAIAEQREKAEAAMNEFQMKMRGTAMLDATHGAAAQLQSQGIPIRALNPQGLAAVKDVQAKWKDTMNDGMQQQLTQDQFINHAHPEAQWQARHDEWVKGMSQDLANVYANRLMTQ